MAEQLPQWKQTLRSRVIVAAVGFALWTAGIEARLVYLQVIRHADLVARAERQQQRTIDAPAKRGEILDRVGHVLAYSVDTDSIYAVPAEIDDAEATARSICRELDTCTARDRRALVDRFNRQRAFVFVRRQVSPEEARRVAALGLLGIGFIKENRRFYPKKELAAHLLGYVGIDNVGLNGIEAAYDEQIRGRAGTVLIQTDARRQAFSRLERPPTGGATLELTIDEYLQYIAERELQAGVRANRAAAGTAVIMDPWTGEILAMANEPTFNPNAFRTSRETHRRNRAVQDLYEPGSTFKIVTASAALEERVIKPHDLIDVSSGHIRFGRRSIEDVHRYGTLSFTDVLVKSSNVGAIKVGLRLGAERLNRYVSRFGFGRPMSPDFPGESAGIVWNPAQLNDSALASVSMGYQVGVTALQMATAVSSVANGGMLMQPRVVRAVVRDGKRTAVSPKAIRRAISAETAAELTTIMEAVVERGTAKSAQMEGYTVAGKTGTAAKLIGGRYSQSEYNSSFVGFVPSRKPAVAIVVVIDSPHGRGYYGGTVAAPVFKAIAEPTLRHLSIGPTIDPIPPVLIARSIPAPTSAMPIPAAMRTIVTIEGASVSSGEFVPDLRGMSARDALRVLGKIGMSGQLVGVGYVVAQRPAPGSPIERGGSCRLSLDRQPSREAPPGLP